jgi:septal ring factor EnvC (AmiA/AmiB activator)
LRFESWRAPAKLRRHLRNPLLVPVTLAGFAAVVLGVLYLQSGRTLQSLKSQLVTAAGRIASLEAGMAATEASRKALAAQLVEFDANLGEAKSKLTVTEARNVQLTREIAQTKAQLQARDRREQDMGSEIARLREEVAAARAAAADSKAVAGYQETIARLEQQLAALPASTPPPPPAPAAAVLTTHRSRLASVVSVGPSSAFVVINYGASHGALPEQRLFIRRGTETLATVHISDVRENFSIAQVRPDTLQAALHKGDSAVLTD